MLWIGGQRQNDHDCGTPFVWKGLNGELAFNYTDWLEGEPTCNDNVEFCVHLWSNHAYRWNDLRCQRETCSVCEYNPVA